MDTGSCHSSAHKWGNYKWGGGPISLTFIPRILERLIIPYSHTLPYPPPPPPHPCEQQYKQTVLGPNFLARGQAPLDPPLRYSLAVDTLEVVEQVEV